MSTHNHLTQQPSQQGSLDKTNCGGNKDSACLKQGSGCGTHTLMTKDTTINQTTVTQPSSLPQYIVKEQNVTMQVPAKVTRTEKVVLVPESETVEIQQPNASRQYNSQVQVDKQDFVAQKTQTNLQPAQPGTFDKLVNNSLDKGQLDTNQRLNDQSLLERRT